MGNSILYRMPSGIPGDVTRKDGATIETQQFNSAAAFPGYGLPGKISSGKFVPFAGGEAIGVLYGFLVRPYPTQGANASDPLGTAVPKTTGPCDVLKRGYINVQVNAGTASLGSTVYIRVAAAAAGKPIGGIEAAADSTNTIALTNAYFTGAADASGNAEIAYNL